MNTGGYESNSGSSGSEGSLSMVEQLRLDGQLPSPKGVALAIMELCRHEDVTTEQIARVVQTDPALAGRLLKLANIAANGAGRPVASIPDAIMRLGQGTVRQVAMGFSLVDQYRHGPCAAFDYDRFWSHSLLMGVAMQALGTLTKIGSADELFACGLMARIGGLALATAHPVEYAGLLERCRDDSQLIALERQHLHTDHNDITSAILGDCGIPKALIEPIHHHEAPEASGFTEGSRPHRLTHLFHHAKRLADLGVAMEAERAGIISELMLLGGKLGLDVNELGGLVDGACERWREWGKILQVPAAALPPFAAMVSAPAPKAETREPPLQPIRVLLVEDEESTRMVMEVVLKQIIGCEVFSATNGQEALTMAVETMPKIVIADWMMPVLDGIGFCKALRATDWGQTMYVIMMTGLDAEEDVVQAFEAGVDDYIAKPVNVRALRARMRAALHYVKLLDAWERDRARLKQFAAELAISNRKFEHSAMTDQLTGLPNRRAGLETLSQAWSAASRSGHGLAVMMIDIDRFKSVNDTHGHAAGDRVLTEVGKLIRATSRKDDHVSRMGGEEFLMVCRDVDLKSTYLAAERLRHNVRDTILRIGDIELRVTVSIGIAAKEESVVDTDNLVIAADRALYAAKQSGRDRSWLSVDNKLFPRLD
jgi:diguanylate cyclase (GGDEF)-like protein